MTNANDPIKPLAWVKREDGIPELNTEGKGLTKREYFAANSGISWNEAAINCDAKLGRTSTIQEVADYFSRMKIIAADALITALNQIK